MLFLRRADWGPLCCRQIHKRERRSLIEQAEIGRRFALTLGAALIGAMLLSGCADTASTRDAAANDPEFVAWFAAVGDDIAADPRYNRMPIDTDAQGSEFSAKLHQAYRGEITEAEFAQWANATYPGHGYEVDFFTQRLPG